jgi:NADH dehydrogenase [ubiquinone] 1 alpha subcomplex assembly factor 2
MAKRERGLFRMIFTNFIKSITPNSSKTICVGTDHFGTKYFEHINSKSEYKRSRRYFVPIDKTNFEQDLPCEWESWLRHRRADPPTNEEVILKVLTNLIYV